MIVSTVDDEILLAFGFVFINLYYELAASVRAELLAGTRRKSQQTELCTQAACVAASRILSHKVITASPSGWMLASI